MTGIAHNNSGYRSIAGSHSKREKPYVRDRLRHQTHPRDPMITEFTYATVSPVCDELLRAFV